MNVKRSILSGGLAAAVVAAAFVLFPSTSRLVADAGCCSPIH